jgi:hypothetical protein
MWHVMVGWWCGWRIGVAVRLPHEIDGWLARRERWIPCGWWWLRSSGDIPCLDLFLWWYWPEREGLSWRGAHGAWRAQVLVLVIWWTWWICDRCYCGGYPWEVGHVIGGRCLLRPIKGRSNAWWSGICKRAHCDPQMTWGSLCWASMD